MKTNVAIAITILVTLLVSACVPVLDDPAATATPEVEEVVNADMVELAAADGRFTTLLAAVEAAGLTDILRGEGPFTLFAPTDDAFAALPEGTVEGLLADIPALTNILLYHVVPGQVMAADVVTLESADTAAELPLSITVADGNVYVNDAQVIIPDVIASNGVIHVVDAVLLPPAGEGQGDEPTDEEMTDEAMDIVDTAVADGRFTSLVAAVQIADLAETLKGEGPFTLFAPTDDAFNALPAGTIEALVDDVPTLTDILLYHVVPGKLMAAEVAALDSADTAAGSPLSISVSEGGVYVNDALVLSTDIETSNGVIHVIDSILLPPSGEGVGDDEQQEEMSLDLNLLEIAAADGRFTTLLAAVEAAGLTDTLRGEGPFTLFAPTDEAFALLPEGTVQALLEDIPALTNILLYHVVPGQVMAADAVALDSADTAAGLPLSIAVADASVYINDAQVLIPDVVADNGVIHVIDSVLLPPAAEAEEGMTEEMEEVTDDPAQISEGTTNIVDVAATDGRFATVLAAIEAAGLTDILRDEGPFTLFAPTDEAFALLPEGTIQALLEDIPALTNILLYHVVPGQVMAADASTLASADTAAGLPLDIAVTDGTLYINNAQVIIADVVAENGVIHAIDSVLLPPAAEAEEGMSEEMEEAADEATQSREGESAANIVDVAAADGRFTTLLSAAQAAGLVDTLTSDGPFTLFAPTDEAFAQLPKGTLNRLLKDIPALREILLFHVVPGEFRATELAGHDRVRSAAGLPLNLKVRKGDLSVRRGHVILADIEASNGVIHAIDRVLIPSKTSH